MNGFTLYLDRTDEAIVREFMSGEYEPLGTELMQRLIRPGMAVLDIGANIGYYTLLYARQVGPKGAVYAFEPTPDTFSMLRKNIQSNGFSDTVRLIEAAVSDHSGTAEIFINQYNKGDNRLYGSGSMRRVPVETKRLDDIFSAREHVDFIKMDIQGAEGLALRGMRDIIARDHPVIVMEFWPRLYTKLDSSAREILETLSAAGYSFEDIDDEANDVRPATVPELLARYPDDAEGGTNILCRVR